ncbi:MAG: tRNA lysidine(34) synthetase TilS [Bacteroidota bacterium]
MKSLESFLESLSRLGVNKQSRVLIAVSGGVDSMALMHLFHAAQIPSAVAHCNFNLRGNDSNADEMLVKNTANHLGLEFYSKGFQTGEFARDNRLSIQMAARMLRYDWFQELATTNQYDFIATAHHADDQVETILLNLTKGTGLAGMHGIPESAGKIIRPLIRLSRKDIIHYAQQHSIQWREDASNNESDYERNFIRNEVLPMLRSINPSVTEAIIKHSNIMARYENLIDQMMADIEKQIIRFEHLGLFKTIDIEKLTSYPEPATILFHLVRNTGMSFQQCENAVKPNVTSGAVFESGNWNMIKDRNQLVVFDKEALGGNEETEIPYPGETANVFFGTFDSSIVDGVDEKDFINPAVAYLDANKIQWPITIRSVNNGDRFHPLGMNQSKLISDFFIDGKIGTPQKMTTYILFSDGQPIWLAPLRIDDRFKINENTTSVLRLSFNKP